MKKNDDLLCLMLCCCWRPGDRWWEYLLLLLLLVVFFFFFLYWCCMLLFYFTLITHNVVIDEGASAYQAWLSRRKKRIERARNTRPAMIVETAGVVLSWVEKPSLGRGGKWNIDKSKQKNKGKWNDNGSSMFLPHWASKTNDAGLNITEGNKSNWTVTWMRSQQNEQATHTSNIYQRQVHDQQIENMNSKPAQFNECPISN